MNTHKNNTPPPAHLNPRATETLSLRLLPEIRSFLESEAGDQNVSMTKIALKGFEMLYAAKQRQATGENLAFW
jgi:hypothetical protein